MFSVKSFFFPQMILKAVFLMLWNCRVYCFSLIEPHPNCDDNFFFKCVDTLWTDRMTDENDKQRLCAATDFRSARVHFAQEESGGIRSRFVRLQRGVWLQLLLAWTVKINSCEMRHLFFVFFTLWGLQPATSSISCQFHCDHGICTGWLGLTLGPVLYLEQWGKVHRL